MTKRDGGRKRKEVFAEVRGFAAMFCAVLQAWYARTARMDTRKNETTPKTWPE